MRRKNYKGKVIKRFLPKCNDVCRTYDPIMTAYADLLSQREDIEEFRCNVYLEGLSEGDYTTDFLCKKKDGTYMVRECVYRSRYYPFPMVIEIYNKLYLATSLALKKKNTKLVLKQRNDTYRAMMGDRQYHGIIGGADSFTVIGKSGTGKTSAIMAAINLITDQKVIEVENPFQKIIPCIKVECPFDASAKGLILEILRSVDEIIGTEYYERSRKTSDTTDILIGTISQVALNHIGLLVIDEIQNVWGRKNGTTLISMITQLINSSGISIAMVGTEECIPFFEKGAQLARRAQGLKYNSLLYDEYYAQFCRSIMK